MSRKKKILLGVGGFILALVALFLIVVGPWPTYSSGFEGTGYFNKAVAAIDTDVKQSAVTNTPGPLKAGWGTALITPPPGTPLAGYGDRKGAPSQGVHDDLHVKALALGDGQDIVVLVGADLLLIPPPVAERVRVDVAAATGGKLGAHNLYFAASHTHDGPGAFLPGYLSSAFAGAYDPKVPEFLAKNFTSAILSAYNSMEPAKLAHGKVKATKYIRNRTRDVAVDDEINYLLVEKENGKRCYLLRFSAHPTILSGKNMLVSAEYPGYFQAAIEKASGGTAVYLGGSLGSSSTANGPDAPDPFAKCQAFGETLAQLVLEATKEPKFESNLDIVSVGIPLDLPSLQLRIGSVNWRLSPIAASLVGLPKSAWMQATRVGKVVLVGMPADFSGEISRDWKLWANALNYDLWPTSFCAGYVGYISPDAYYADATKYETGLMSWMGPHQEAYFTALMKHIVEAMKGPVAAAG